MLSIAMASFRRSPWLVEQGGGGVDVAQADTTVISGSCLLVAAAVRKSSFSLIMAALLYNIMLAQIRYVLYIIISSEFFPPSSAQTLRNLSVKAVMENNADLLADALVLGARPNMMISTRESYLLHNAARLGHIECVRELLYAGANPMLLDNNVLPPICYTNGRSIGDLPGVPLTERHLACAIVLLMFAPDCTNEQSVKAGALRVFVCCCRFSLSSFVWRVTDVGFANMPLFQYDLLRRFNALLFNTRSWWPEKHIAKLIELEVTDRMAICTMFSLTMLLLFLCCRKKYETTQRRRHSWLSWLPNCAITCITCRRRQVRLAN
jgi:hypothetical protein